MKKKKTAGTRLPSHADWSRYKPLSEGLQHLVDQAASGHTGVRWMLSHLAHTVHPLKFRLFCEGIPTGTELVNLFQREQIQGDPIVGWRIFLMKIIKTAIQTGRPLAPQGCQHSNEERLARWKGVKARKASQKIRLQDVLAAHFGEPEQTKRVKYIFCVDCIHTGCAHNPGFRLKKQSLQQQRDEESGARPLRTGDGHHVPSAPKKRHLRLVASSPRW